MGLQLGGPLIHDERNQWKCRAYLVANRFAPISQRRILTLRLGFGGIEKNPQGGNSVQLVRLVVNVTCSPIKTMMAPDL